MQNNQEAIRKTSLASSIVLALDMVDLSGIFFFRSATDAVKLIFEQTLRYIMLPFAAASAIFLAVLSWRQAVLKKYEGHAIAKAVFDTVCAAALTTAIAGGFIVAATFAIAGPAMIAGAFGLKALFNAGSSIYFGVQSARIADPVKKYEYRKQAAESAIAAFVGIGSTIAVITAMLLAKPMLAIIGVFTAVFGCATAVVKAIDLANQKPAAPDAAPAPEKPGLTTNAALTKALKINSAPEISVTDTRALGKSAVTRIIHTDSDKRMERYPEVNVETSPAPSP